ncbi:MAG: TIGR00266 family protein [Leptospiraceae bacterium]|nr:TIGR00266 family protein [Leptospiraceae bacterium]MCB1322525.1 TIGR00266 family protein [Leptospiraceae bacterium]
MKATINGAPSFCFVHIDLEPGETIIAESDAMASMDAEIAMETKFNGGFFSGLLKKFLGGESLFVNHFTNKSDRARRVTVVQPTPGEIRQIDLNGQALCLQPGAYVASTPGVKLGLKWAGLASFIAREGLFKLEVSGSGTVWYGAYGGLVEKEVDGAYIVDTAHLVAYDPQMKLKAQLAGGILSSFFGGEGLVTRVEGKGRIVMQSRSLSGLAGWVNPRL